MSQLKKIRFEKFHEQNGECYYCAQPMWLDACGEFATSTKRTFRESRLLQATAEHLQARCEGGRDTPDNIVAACRWCNTRRHARKTAPPPEAFLALVRRRIARGKWHGFLKRSHLEIGN